MRRVHPRAGRGGFRAVVRPEGEAGLDARCREAVQDSEPPEPEVTLRGAVRRPGAAFVAPLSAPRRTRRVVPAAVRPHARSAGRGPVAEPEEVDLSPAVRGRRD